MAMPRDTVTATGTIPRVSPRRPDALPPDVAARLARAATSRSNAHQTADAKLKAAVIAALAHGSVRQVAAAAGLSPTTVHAWSKGQDR